MRVRVGVRVRVRVRVRIRVRVRFRVWGQGCGTRCVRHRGRRFGSELTVLLLQL